MTNESIQKSEKKKSCVNCGAELRYKTGSTHIKCDYCSYEEEIEPIFNSIDELDLYSYLQNVGSNSHTQEITMLHCKSCGANQHIEENYKSLQCVYCSEPLILEESYNEDWITPGAVLPFQLQYNQSVSIFKKWVKGLWFAPNKLQKASLKAENIKGLYVPYWTFDAQLYAKYTGERGTYYYQNESYTTTENGKSVRRTRQVRKTRWHSTSGSVSGFVDDTIVNASRKQKNEIPAEITRWNLDELEPFNSKYLSGFVTEKYTISLKDGHLESQEEMNHIANNWARQDIGGDTQRVHSLKVNLNNETFKHILLPIYIANYVYNGKKYHFYINGQTGVISGNRPYSFWKIFFVVLFAMVIIGIFIFFNQQQA